MSTPQYFIFLYSGKDPLIKSWKDFFFKVIQVFDILWSTSLTAKQKSNVFVLFLPSIVERVCFLYVSAYNLKVSRQFFCWVLTPGQPLEFWEVQQTISCIFSAMVEWAVIGYQQISHPTTDRLPFHLCFGESNPQITNYAVHYTDSNNVE